MILIDMYFFLLFIAELLILFFISQRLISAIFTILNHLHHKPDLSIWTLAIFFLPGTFVHELSHFLMAKLLFVPTGRVEFIPQMNGQSLKLGSAEIGLTDPLRRTLIGIAPFIFGVTLIIGCLYLFTYLYLQGITYTWWMVVLIIFSVFQIGNTMFTSKKDMEGTVLVFSLVIVILLALYFFNLLDLVWISKYLFTAEITALFKFACIFVAIPIVIDSLLYLLCRKSLNLIEH